MARTGSGDTLLPVLKNEVRKVRTALWLRPTAFCVAAALAAVLLATLARSEEHTSELQSLMRISYAVFCLKKKKKQHNNTSRELRHILSNNSQSYIVRPNQYTTTPTHKQTD